MEEEMRLFKNDVFDNEEEEEMDPRPEANEIVPQLCNKTSCALTEQYF